MFAFLQSLKKEFLLLTRDFGALIILFLMPVTIVILVTFIQNISFQKMNEINIPIVVLDKDNGSLSKEMMNLLNESDNFSVSLLKSTASDMELKNKVLNEDNKIGIILPENLSASLEQKVSQKMNVVFAQMGVGQDTTNKTPIEVDEIEFLFNPDIQASLKENIRISIREMLVAIENKLIYQQFESELGIEMELEQEKSLVSFKEIYFDEKKIPNASQHNVPAWTIFAIFFIVIPFGMNMVKEKTDGTFIRLTISPISYHFILVPKIIVYLGVCMLQFVLIFLLGIYLFPHIGLPPLVVTGSYFALVLLSFTVGLAAIGLGLLIGTLFKSTEQSAPFGATLVIILSAIGGIWVPLFVMPKFLQLIALISPLNWGLEGYYKIILKNGNLADILPSILSLLLFFMLCYVLAFYKNAKNTRL